MGFVGEGWRLRLPRAERNLLLGSVVEAPLAAVLLLPRKCLVDSVLAWAGFKQADQSHRDAAGSPARLPSCY